MHVHVGYSVLGLEAEQLCFDDLDTGIAMLRTLLSNLRETVWQQAPCGCPRELAWSCPCPVCFTDRRIAGCLSAIDGGEVRADLRSDVPAGHELRAATVVTTPDGMPREFWVAVLNDAEPEYDVVVLM